MPSILRPEYLTDAVHSVYTARVAATHSNRHHRPPRRDMMIEAPPRFAAALVLTRAGRSVVVVEKSHYEQARIGETLPPTARV